MNRISASITSIALAVAVLTGCGTEQGEDCREDESMSSMSIADGRAGGSSGGGSRGGSSVSRPNMNKPAKPVKPASPTKTGSGSKAKAPKVHIDDEDCD